MGKRLALLFIGCVLVAPLVIPSYSTSHAMHQNRRHNQKVGVKERPETMWAIEWQDSWNAAYTFGLGVIGAACLVVALLPSGKAVKSAGAPQP